MEHQKLEDILKSLIGSEVAISYVHSPGSEENAVSGILEGLSKDVIQIKEKLMGSSTTVWLNRHNSTLTAVRLLGTKKKRKK